MEKSKINTINIKGKEYATVDSRVEFFRENYPNWSIETEFPVLDLDKGICVCKAVIKDEAGKVIADGYAHEWQSKPGSLVNKTSYIENAQTSAVGRALGFVGVGINGMGIATAEEVQLAIDHDTEHDYPVTPQTINDIVQDSIPDTPKEKHLSEKAQRDIDMAMSVNDLKSIYNAYAFSEPINELKAACTKKKQELEETPGPYDN